MERCFYSLLILIFCGACQSDKPAPPSVAMDQNATSPTSALQIHEIEAQVSLAALGPQAAKSVTGLCEKSKGYRSNEWQGFNTCDWALEKQLLREEKERAKRQSTRLSIRLAAQKWLNLSPPNELTTYQYRGYLAPLDRYLILIHQTGHCPAFWLIDAQTGDRQHFQGHPYFSEDYSTAIVSSAAANGEEACNRQLSLWQFQDGQLQQKRQIPTQNRTIEKLFWNGKKEVLLRQSSPDATASDAHYGRIEL